MTQPDAATDGPAQVKLRRLRQTATIGSFVMLAGVWLCLVTQPDWLAPVILVPTWCWLIFGGMLACGGFHSDRKQWFVSVLLLWAVFAWLFVEQTHSLVHGKSLSPVEWQAARESGRGIRIVSLNCNVGQSRCVEEVASHDADVVLLQESPGEEQLQVLTEALFGSEGTFLFGGDVSILARGNLSPRFADRSSHFVHAVVELPKAEMIDVVSVRLSPPVPRIDFWSLGFWHDHCQKRIKHREQVQEIINHLQSVPTERHVIVGGDFNAPPSDDSLSRMRSRLSDSFLKAGSGWGATGTNTHPLFRVDQVWASDRLKPASVVAWKTQHSDHRMVVCDLLIAE